MESHTFSSHRESSRQLSRMSWTSWPCLYMAKLTWCARHSLENIRKATVVNGGGTFYQVFICIGLLYFHEGNGRHSEFVVEALLAYWLSWLIFSSGREDGWNDYVFLLAFLLAKGKKVALAPIYLEPLYAQVGWVLCEHDTIARALRCCVAHQFCVFVDVPVGTF